MGADACGVSSTPSIIDTDAVAVVPAQLLQRLAESLEIVLLLNIFGERIEHADAPHALTLLRARHKRPRRRTAEECDEVAPLHSITSSAVASSACGTLRPSILAVGMLMTSSNLVDCTTGKSAGFAPLRMRPV